MTVSLSALEFYCSWMLLCIRMCYNKRSRSSRFSEEKFSNL